MNVKLRANLIIIDTGGKVFLKEGTVVDLQKIPTKLRKRRYIIKEGERDLRSEKLKQQMAYAEGETNDVEELLEESEGTVKRLPRR